VKAFDMSVLVFPSLAECRAATARVTLRRGSKKAIYDPGVTTAFSMNQVPG
jgi:hypothetical protein